MTMKWLRVGLMSRLVVDLLYITVHSSSARVATLTLRSVRRACLRSAWRRFIDGTYHGYDFCGRHHRQGIVRRLGGMVREALSEALDGSCGSAAGAAGSSTDV